MEFVEQFQAFLILMTEEWGASYAKDGEEENRRICWWWS